MGTYTHEEELSDVVSSCAQVTALVQNVASRGNRAGTRAQETPRRLGIDAYIRGRVRFGVPPCRSVQNVPEVDNVRNGICVLSTSVIENGAQNRTYRRFRIHTSDTRQA